MLALISRLGSLIVECMKELLKPLITTYIENLSLSSLSPLDDSIGSHLIDVSLSQGRLSNVSTPSKGIQAVVNLRALEKPLIGLEQPLAQGVRLEVILVTHIPCWFLDSPHPHALPARREVDLFHIVRVERVRMLLC